MNAEHERFKKIDAAFRAGDLDQLRTAVEDPSVVPNGPMPLTIGPCLNYAIYHSPIRFIRALLELGADPNPDDDRSFPPLIAAISCGRPRPGSTPRTDVLDVLGVLIEFGADLGQRGVNDYTPLHMAVSEGNLEALEFLLHAGADPTLRTRIDDYETPRGMAERAGRQDMARLLAEHEARPNRSEG